MTAQTNTNPTSSVSDPKSMVIPPGSIATAFSMMAFALLSDDWTTVDAALSDDVEWHMMPNAQILKGKSAVVAFLKAAFYAAQRTPKVIGSQRAGDWGVLEYWNIGTINERLVAFAKASGWPFPGDPAKLAGRTYKVPVCFIYHINAAGKIDLVREYLDVGSVIAQFK